MGIQEITLEKFKSTLLAQGVDKMDFQFECPMCGKHQSPRDLVNAGAGKSFDEVEKFIAFSCVGRWSDSQSAFSVKEKDPNGIGCDWTLGGFLSIAALTIVLPDGTKHPRFRPVNLPHPNSQDQSK